MSHQTVGPTVFCRCKIETAADFLIVLGKQRRQFLTLIARIRGHGQRAEPVHIQALDLVQSIVQIIQRRSLDQQTVVYMQISSAFLHLTSNLIEVIRLSVCLLLGRRRTGTLRLLFISCSNTLSLRLMVLHPAFAHTVDLFERDRYDFIAKTCRNSVDTPEGTEIISGAVIMKERHDCRHAIVDFKIVRVENVLLFRLDCQKVRISIEVRCLQLMLFVLLLLPTKRQLHLPVFIPKTGFLLNLLRSCFNRLTDDVFQLAVGIPPFQCHIYASPF